MRRDGQIMRLVESQDCVCCDGQGPCESECGDPVQSLTLVRTLNFFDEGDPENDIVYTITFEPHYYCLVGESACQNVWQDRWGDRIIVGYSPVTDNTGISIGGLGETCPLVDPDVPGLSCSSPSTTVSRICLLSTTPDPDHYYEIVDVITPGGDDDCVPPDPPDPPEDNCDGLDECEEETEAILEFTDMLDYDEAFTNHVAFGGGVTGTTHWLLSNLLGEFVLPQDGGVYDYAIELYTPGTYATAVADGILIRQDDIDDGGFTDAQYEVYVYKIELGIECVDGYVHFDYLTLHYDTYIGSNEGSAWPTPNGQFSATFSAPLFFSEFHAGNATGGCRTGATYGIVMWADDPGANSCILNPLDPSTNAEHTFGAAFRIDF